MEILCDKTISISYYVMPVLGGEQRISFTLIESVNFSVTFHLVMGFRIEDLDFKVRVCVCVCWQWDIDKILSWKYNLMILSWLTMEL